MFKLLYYRTLYSQSAASLTIGYLAAYIRQLGATAEISLLELGGMNNAQKVLRNTNPLDIIIYKVNYQDYKEGCEILRAVKHFCPDRKVYLLGYFAEMNCAALGKKYDFIDGIIFHDGCHFIQKYLESNGDELYGGMFKKEPQNSFFYNDQVKNIPLSELPFPARDIEKLEKHSYINITKSVGCYGKCSFCHINLIHRNFSTRSVQSVVDEMCFCQKELGKKMFIFNDSAFWFSHKDDSMIDEFVDLLKKKKLRINFMIYLKCTPFIGKKRLQKLKEVGLCRVFIGIENISNRFLDEYHKKVLDYYEILMAFQELKISHHIGFILFHPHVTIPELRENIEFLFRLKKLFRIGIIVEKMRMLPRNNKDTSFSSNNEVDKAYDYNFDNQEVSMAFDLLCSFYKCIDVRNFENVCTSTLFLINLYQNEYGDENAAVFNLFINEVNEFNQYAYQFYCRLFNLVEEKASYSQIWSVIEKNQPDFIRYYYNFESLRGLVYDYIGHIDEDLCKMVFHGQRRLNIDE